MNLFKVGVISPVIIAAFISHAAYIYAQDHKPTIEISVQILDESIDNGNTPSLMYNWTTINCDYVLIDGYDDKPHEPNGSIVYKDGVGFTFIAVGPNDVIFEYMACRIIKHSLMGHEKPTYALLPESTSFEGSYKKLIKPPIELKDIEIKIRDVLQGLKYFCKTSSGNFARENLIMSTTNFVPCDEICDQGDCQINDENRIHEIGFQIKLQSEKQSPRYTLCIAPIVIKRHKKDRNFQVEDISNEEIITQVQCMCKQLADTISNKLENKYDEK